MNERSSMDISRALIPGFEKSLSLPRGYFEHPEYPDKVVRYESFSDDILETLPYVRDLLEDLEHIYDIPTVHTTFAITGDRTSVEVIMVSDKIADAIPAETALEAAAGDNEIAEEFDALSCRMTAHIADVINQGGVHIREYYRYSQFVYSPSAEEGKRVILVDTDPIGIWVEPKPILRQPGTAPTSPLEALMSITEDVVRLEKRIGYPSKAGIELRKAAQRIDSGNQSVVERARLAIEFALEHGDESVLGWVEDDDEFYNNPLRDAHSSSLLLETYIKQRKA